MASNGRPEEYNEFNRVEWNSRWDYVFVFRVAKATESLNEYQSKFSLRKVVTRLREAGLITKMFLSVQRDEVYVKVQAPYERLLQRADQMDTILPVDEIAAQDVATQPKRVYNPLSGQLERPRSGEPEFRPPANTTPIPPFRYLFAKYDREPGQQKLYLRYPSLGVFSPLDRLKLVLSIIRAPRSVAAFREGRATGAGLDPDKMLLQNAILAFYPLHVPAQRDKLRAKWMQWTSPPWRQPMESTSECVGIRDYYGEKIALYFAWLGHYTTWLISAAAAGLGVFLAQLGAGTQDTWLLLPYSCFMMAWAVLFQEAWKRKQNTYKMMWGTKDFETTEQLRPTFRGTRRASPVTGRQEVQAEPLAQRLRRAVSTSIISLAVGCVVAVTLGIMAFRVWSTTVRPVMVRGTNVGGQLAALLNAVSIQILNRVYGALALKLNEYENHATDTLFDDALVAKVFAFQFVNSNASLFYIAFVKGHMRLVGQDTHCANDSCLDELSQQLGTIFLTQIVVNNALEVALPMAKRMLAARRQAAPQRLGEEDEGDGIELRGRAGSRASAPPSSRPIRKTAAEEQFELAPYNGQSLFGDYAEMAINFGYCTLFVTAFPLAPLCALLNNFLEIRERILELMAQVAVMTNLGVLCFTSTVFDGASVSQRFVIFLLAEHVLLGIRYLFTLIDDVPHDVAVQLERQDYVVRRLLNIVKGIPEDDDDDDDDDSGGNAIHGGLTGARVEAGAEEGRGAPPEWFAISDTDR